MRKKSVQQKKPQLYKGKGLREDIVEGGGVGPKHWILYLLYDILLARSNWFAYGAHDPEVVGSNPTANLHNFIR